MFLSCIVLAVLNAFLDEKGGICLDSDPWQWTILAVVFNTHVDRNGRLLLVGRLLHKGTLLPMRVSVFSL